MKSLNAFVNKEHYSAFSCPSCQVTHRAYVAERKGSNHKIAVNCDCGERFEVHLNFRQFYRKSVNLIGEILNVSTNSRDWRAILVVDLSMSGLRFKCVGLKGIENGHRLQVRFTLDDQQGNVIDKEIRVVDIRKDYYGCEFLNLAFEEKELGYYLFPT